MPPPYCYDYPRPAVTVDLVVLTLHGSELQVLLIKRKKDPFAGSWALPGGFLNIDEPMEDGARRELHEETGFVPTGPVAFLGVYGKPGRDPRSRTFSLAHVTVVRDLDLRVKGGDDAAEAAWREVRSGEILAFDHDQILADALKWLAVEVKTGKAGLDLLPKEFDEDEVRALYRSLFGSTAGASHWLRRMKRLGLIELKGGSGKRYQAVKTED